MGESMCGAVEHVRTCWCSGVWYHGCDVWCVPGCTSSEVACVCGVCVGCVHCMVTIVWWCMLMVAMFGYVCICKGHVCECMFVGSSYVLWYVCGVVSCWWKRLCGSCTYHGLQQIQGFRLGVLHVGTSDTPAPLFIRSHVFMTSESDFLDWQTLLSIDIPYFNTSTWGLIIVKVGGYRCRWLTSVLWCMCLTSNI